MWRLIQPKGRHLVALVVFVSLLLTLLYVVTRQTDAYEAAERFVSSDARVAESVGTVTRIDFKFWEGFQFMSSANGGEANFTFEVVGSKGGISIIEVHLRSSSGTWRVVTADIRSSEGATSRIVGMAMALSVLALC
jgi:hypothetical protein